MIKENYVGIDGCRAGWFFVSIGPGDESEFGVFETIDKLFNAYIDAKWMLIDIPIGLPHNDMPTRDCDSKARKLLSPRRHHSIFSPPCREALSASNYAEACDINQKVIGRKVSKQAYHVSKKILEVDLLQQNNSRACSILRESHPEVCFYALADLKPMEYYKKTEAGLEERLDLLKQYFPRSSAIYKAALGRYLRKEVAKDDILDALALAITASMLDEGEKRLPETIKKDQLGLPMEIVYAISDQPEKICEPPEQDVIIINDLEPGRLDTDSSKLNSTGTYAIVGAGGNAYLQIETGCSSLDKKNQSIRFDPKAIKRLKAIIENL
jgi:predicted RNase H-like nuclease